MFLNLTNHHSDQWEEKQIQEAEKFGEIIDMEFPLIVPQANLEHVKSLAQSYANKIIDLKPRVVHIMGEMTFTYNLVNLLKESNIMCVASTTQRSTSELGNQVKQSKFEFVQFRSYYHGSNKTEF